MNTFPNVDDIFVFFEFELSFQLQKNDAYIEKANIWIMLSLGWRNWLWLPKPPLSRGNGSNVRVEINYNQWNILLTGVIMKFLASHIHQTRWECQWILESHRPDYAEKSNQPTVDKVLVLIEHLRFCLVIFSPWDLAYVSFLMDIIQQGIPYFPCWLFPWSLIFNLKTILERVVSRIINPCFNDNGIYFM